MFPLVGSAVVHLEEWIASAILVAEARTTGRDMTAPLRTPKLPRTVTRIALPSAIAIVVCCAISEPLLAEPPQPDRAAIDATFERQLEKWATKCDELKLEDQARQSREWMVPRTSGRQVLFVAEDATWLLPKEGEQPYVA